ncbi:MAG: InlB B-repeat-containing protein [Eggerthellaceae bacterium]|nr:InlB B-repeat-containing protein [Eggerthellaceae bacterium]
MTYIVVNGTFAGGVTTISENVVHGSSPVGIPVPVASIAYSQNMGTWDVNPLGAIITDDTDFTYTFAVINTYTVTFVDYDGAVLSAQSVAYGGSATSPGDPTRDGYTFTTWDRGFTYVTSSFTVTALYAAITDTPEAPLVPAAEDPPTPIITPATTVILPPQTPTAPTPITTQITPDATPLDVREVDSGAWALLNLVLSAIGILGALGIFLAFFMRRKKEEDQGAQANQNSQEDPEVLRKKRLALRILNIALGIVACVVFVLTQDMSLPMALVDWWTIVHAVIFVIQIVVVVLAMVRKDNEKKEDKGQMIVEETPLVAQPA